MSKNIARMLICLAALCALLAPDAVAASPAGLGRAWGPVLGHAGSARGAARAGRVAVGSAYGPVTAAPPGARIGLGSAYGPIVVAPVCTRACIRRSARASTVRR